MTSQTGTTIPVLARSRPRRLRRLITVGASAAAALVVWTVAVLVGVELLVTPGGASTQRVGVGSVLVVSLLAGLAGWGLLAALERVTSRARAIWTTIAVVVLLLSLSGPATGAVSIAAGAALAAMHVAVAAVLIVGFRRTTGPRRVAEGQTS